jgi:membrane protein
MPTRRQLETRLRDTIAFVREKLAQHELLTYASAIAFQVVKSLIPLVLLGLAVLGAVGRRDMWSDHIAPALQPRFDKPIFHALDFAANKIFASNSAGLLALSALLTVWYVSSGVRGIMSAINRIYETGETRPPWLRWLVSIGLAVCVVGGIVGAILLVLAVPTPSGG